MKWWPSTVVLFALVLTACAPASPGTQAPAAQGSGQSSVPSAPKILVAALNEDPKNFWDGTNGGGGSGARQLGNVVNQQLAVISSDGTAIPRLLAELPAVSKGTWTVSRTAKWK